MVYLIKLWRGSYALNTKVVGLILKEMKLILKVGCKYSVKFWYWGLDSQAVEFLRRSQESF